MTTHTPGPWTVEYSPADGFSVWHDPRTRGDMRRGTVIICADMRAKPEAEANARLIAAAPDMLAALYLAEQNATDRTALSAIRAAIAKATGA